MFNPTQFYILLALADEDRHGYGIIQEVERRSQGAVRLGPGTLYGAIKRLTADGLIEESSRRPKEDDPRRTCYYRLTKSGRVAAIEHAEQLGALLKAAADKGLVNARSILAVQ